MAPRILALALIVSAFTAGCDGCSEPLAPVGNAPLPVVDEAPPVPVEPEVKPGPRQLSYVGDQPVALFHGGQATLRFTWTMANGAPVPGDVVTIETSGTTATAAGSSFTTDANGAIEVPVTAGVVDGETVVTARATDVDGDIREDSALVSVTTDPVSGLRVTVTSNARIPVTSAQVRLILGAAPPSCAALLGGAPEPAPQANVTFAAIPSTQDLAALPTGARATLVATGATARGVPVARGCSEVGALPGGDVVETTIVLEQDPSVLAGDYDVLMHVALGDALPAPYDATLELVTALLADPAGYAVYVALREMDRQLGTTFVTRDGVEKSYREVEQAVAANPNAYLTWQLGRDNLDQTLASELGQDYVDITNVGAGIRDITTDFEVGARLALEETGAGALQISESWRDVVLYWPLPCADGDLACARRVLSLDDPSLAPVATTYGASWVHAPLGEAVERFAVTTEPHGLAVRYGALILAILDQVVFPSLPEGVAGDSFGDVLGNLVQCDDVAASLFDDPVASLFIGMVCEAGISIAAAELEQQLIALQVDATNPTLGEEGLAAGGSFTLRDADLDLTTELVNDYSFAVSWNDPADAAATQDIAAPIRGDGVRSLPTCTDDSTCAAGLTCQPHPSYLKVARVELGCARPVGANVGGEACASHDDCQSGLCAPVGNGGGLACFAACDELGDCGVQQVCSEVGGTIDLDGTMSGLGFVAVRGCAAL